VLSRAISLVQPLHEQSTLLDTPGRVFDA